MAVALYATQGDQATLLKSLVLNHDGRTDAPLFDNHSLKAGTYRLTFDVAGYFKARGVQLPEPNFLNQVSLDFGVAHTDQHYHVPLLVSPWSYSTTAARDASELPLGQRVELEAPRLVPQPGVGIGHALHARRHGKGAAARTVRSISATTSGAWRGARIQRRADTRPMRSMSTSSTPIAYSMAAACPGDAAGSGRKGGWRRPR
jgi:5-hydroxyisourate hydrolase